MNKEQGAKEKLFDSSKIFTGNVKSILKGYPPRSKHLEEKMGKEENAKDLDSKFIKEGNMYLLRGAKVGQETGFYTKTYRKKETIESKNMDPCRVAEAHGLLGDTSFISATTSLLTAATFANGQRIYILKMPVEDVYRFHGRFSFLEESEYLIPDFIAQEEIIASYRYNKLRQVYNYLTKQVGLEVTPEEMGVLKEFLDHPDEEELKSASYYALSSMKEFDPLLIAMKDSILEGTEEEFKQAMKEVIEKNSQDKEKVKKL